MGKIKIPTALNGLLFGSLFALFAAQLLLFPFLIKRNPLSGALIVLPVFLTNTFWYVIHESFHNNFSPVTSMNRLAGRLLCILYGCPWRFLQFGHLVHHRYNRSGIDRTDFFDPARESYPHAALRYYAKLFGGLYFLELISAALLFLPAASLSSLTGRVFSKLNDTDSESLRTQAERTLLSETPLTEMRVDFALSLALHVTAFYLYASYWWVLFISLIGRAFLISFADNLPHYGTDTGQREYAYNLALPRWAARLLLNFNYHGVHHLRPSIPWIALEAAFKAGGRQFDANYFKQAMKQLLGPVPLTETPGATTLCERRVENF